VHVAEDVAPIALDAAPAAQLVQLEAPEIAYLPAGHDEHDDGGAVKGARARPRKAKLARGATMAALPFPQQHAPAEVTAQHVPTDET